MKKNETKKLMCYSERFYEFIISETTIRCNSQQEQQQEQKHQPLPQHQQPLQNLLTPFP